MAGKDKHPPLSPKRFSTNKRLTVGEKNAGIGAKFEKPAPTRKQAAIAKAVSATQSPAAKRNDKFLGKVSSELSRQKKTGVISDPNLLYNLDRAKKAKVKRTMT